MLSIAVLVSGSGTNLQALIDAEKTGKIKNGKVTLVVSNKADAYALTRAQNAGIQTTVIPSAGRRDAFERELTDLLLQNSIDLIVLAGFMVILSANFVKTFENKIINVHPSLIPSFCGDGMYGLHVHRGALDYGVKVTGATVHFVSEITDGGRIIAQKAVEVQPNDTPETLQKRVMEQAEWEILPRAVSDFCEGKLN